MLPGTPTSPRRRDAWATCSTQPTFPYKVFGAEETTHSKLNANLGLPDDPATKELFKFVDALTAAKR